MDHVRVGGVRLEARWWNREARPTAAPVVLLHEGLGSVSAWKDFPAGLTPRFMHEEAEHTLPRVLDEAGIHRAVLVGHSDGASIALLAAAAAPPA